MPGPDAELVRQLQQGDAEAGRRFVRDYYPGVYRYLLYLTGRREAAEDLTQETFVQAWRRLETFDNRAPLKPWLHRIAHREFLQALRSRHDEASLEEIPEAAAPPAGDPASEVELRAVMARLSLEAREVIVLHYLEGYSYQEIAKILGAPVSTVKFRLAAARTALMRELGEGDLSYLNGVPEALSRRRAWLPLEALTALEARLSYRSADLPVGVTADRMESTPRPRNTGRKPRTDADRKVGATEGEYPMSDHTPSGMSRRQLLEAAGSAAAAAAAASLAGPAAAAAPNEAEVIDERLTRKVTLAVKATALSDLCALLRRDTGIEITAGPSVADEKVTLFCEKLPLREVMRQLSRPFGYTWLRSTRVKGEGGRVKGTGDPSPTPYPLHPSPSADYRYELVQDLRSQLLEEELRNRDRNSALIALDQDMQRYRPYLDLSPDEAEARAKTAAPQDRKLLENLGRAGWGPIQMYFRLTSQQQAALVAGQELKFSQGNPPTSWVPGEATQGGGEPPLPADIARGVLQSQRDLRIIREKDPKHDSGQPGSGEQLRGARPGEEGGLPPSAVPEVRAGVTLKLQQTELGRFGFSGSAEVHLGGSTWGNDNGPYAIGLSHSALQPENAAVNARLAADPALRRRVSVEPIARCGSTAVDPGAGRREPESGVAPTDNAPFPTPGAKLTTADALEALHRATGIPIVADFYTRLFAPEDVTLHDQPLFGALNQLADALRLRWTRDTAVREAGYPRSGWRWLQFRSMSFYNDRLKEVPNRLLARWAAARREHGALRLEELIEIAGLPDAPLDALDMAEGARLCWGLAEWDLACNDALRPHLRWMASFTAAERQTLQRPPGLRFPELSLPQQQQFMALAIGSDPNAIDSLAELETATMQVDYSLPGGFEWKAPEKPDSPPEPMDPVRAPTREAALAAARRVDPQADPTQIEPTVLSLTLLYRWGTPQANGYYRINTHRRGDTSIGRGRSKSSP